MEKSFPIAILARIFFTAAFVFAAFALPHGAQAQEGMSATELKDAASGFIKDKKYVEARPFVKKMIELFEESNDKNLRDELPQLTYFYAFSFLQEYSASRDANVLRNAIANFDKIITKYPSSEFAISALETKADCQDELERYQDSSKTRETLLSHPFVDKLNYSQQLDVIRRAATLLFNVRNFTIGEKWFKLLFDRAKLESDKNFAASALVQVYASKRDFNQLRQYFPFLVKKSPARSDIRLNMALLEAGDSLVERGKFGEASMFYDMVMGRDQIISDFQGYYDEAQKAYERAKALNPKNPKLSEMERIAKLYSSQLNAVKRMPDYTVGLMARAARNFSGTKRDFEGYWSYLRIVRDFPKDPQIEQYYFLAIVSAVRINKWDAVLELGNEYIARKDFSKFMPDVKEQIVRYYLEKKDYNKFFAKAREFLQEYPDLSPNSTNMIYYLGKAWLDRKDYDTLIKVLGALQKKVEEDNPESTIVEACMYWQGIAYLSKSDFVPAAKILNKMVDNFPMGPYAPDGMYRSGVASFGSGDYPTAQKTLETFIDTYPENEKRGEVEFFLGDIFANMGMTQDSIDHYTQVEKYTKEESFISNAYIQSAKLLHNDERYTDEIELMKKYIAAFPEWKCSEASFNIAQAQEMLGRPADALKTYSDAIVKYGSNPYDDGVDKMILDYKRMLEKNKDMFSATAAFIKEVLSDKKLLNTMVYIPAQRYRYFLAHPKIDKRLYDKFKKNKLFGEYLLKNPEPLKKMLSEYEEQLKSFPENTESVFLGILKNASAKKDTTLAYRIMMGLDSIGKPVEFNHTFTADDFKVSSVRTLVWIASLNRKYGADPARAALDAALAREEYEYLVDALFFYASLEAGEKNWPKALSLYSRIYDEFPADDRAPKAVILKADALAKLNEKAKAKAEYESVLKSPSWRGEAYAEALYKLGELSREAGNLDEAGMFYERCFLGFSSYTNWTGKAVLAQAKILFAKGKNAEAKAICTEFLENAANRKSPDFDAVKLFNDTL